MHFDVTNKFWPVPIASLDWETEWTWTCTEHLESSGTIITMAELIAHQKSEQRKILKSNYTGFLTHINVFHLNSFFAAGLIP